MKRLYHCTAWYDAQGLISYNTRIIYYKSCFVNFHKEYKVTLYNYRSTTTLSHIRKYIKLLEDNGMYELAVIISELYEVAKKYKGYSYIIWDFNCRIMVTNEKYLH